MPKRKPKALPAEQAALLAAIVAQPDDDTARLVYADWLQEHDDEQQAQFIRDGIKFAKMKGDTPKRRKMGKDLRQLEMEHGREWLKPLGIESPTPYFTRGLAESVFYEEPEDYFREEEAVFRLLPVHSLGFGIGDGTGFTNKHLRRLSRTPELARIRSLELHDHTDCWPKYWRELFHSPHLSGLTFLRIVGCEFGDAEAEVLASSPTLKALTELELEKNLIGRDGCRALVNSPHLANVTKIQLTDNDFGSQEEFEEAESLIDERYDGNSYCSYESMDDEDDD